MNKYIVTGATGHIGNNVIKKLLKRGENITAVVRKNADLTALEGLNLNYEYGDVTDKNFVMSLVEEGTIVFHFAGVIDINIKRNENMWKTNIEGTKNIVDACIVKKAKKLVYTSSVHAIEAVEGAILKEPTTFDESVLDGDYAKTKAIATRYVFEKAKQGLNATVVYPAGVTGPNDYKVSNIGQSFVDYANKKMPAYITGKYNFIDVRDLADGIISASDKGKIGEGYLLSGSVMTVYEMIDCFRKKVGRKNMPPKAPLFLARFIAKIADLLPRRKTTRPTICTYSINVINSNCNFDNSKAKKELDFKHRTNEESLSDAADWLMENKPELFKKLK